MDNDDEFHNVAEACLATHKLLMLCGTPRVKLVSKLLLLEIGKELSARSAKKRSCRSSKCMTCETSDIQRLIVLLEIGKQLVPCQDKRQKNPATTELRRKGIIADGLNDLEALLLT